MNHVVAHYRSEHWDLHISRNYGNLVLEGFVKSDNTLKHLVWQVDDAELSTARDLVLRHGHTLQRPYLLGGLCDGSISAPVFALYLDFCSRHNLDAQALLNAAYIGVDELEPEAVSAFAHWQGVQIPYRWTQACFTNLLASLDEINYRSLGELLETAAADLSFPSGAVERGGYVAFRGNTRTYGPEARFTWGHVVTPTGEHYWRYDPWQSKNGVVPKHYWLSFIAVAAGQDGKLELKRRVLEEALSLARSPANKGHYAWWLGSLGLEAA